MKDRDLRERLGNGFVRIPLGDYLYGQPSTKATELLWRYVKQLASRIELLEKELNLMYVDKRTDPIPRYEKLKEKL